MSGMYPDENNNHGYYIDEWDYGDAYKEYEQKCMIVEFFKNNPDASSACISCNCKRCSITC